MSTAATATEVKDAGKAPACNYDLTMKFVKYLDPHLSVMMIDFIEARNIYPVAEVTLAKMKMLLKTFCVGKAEETLAKLKELGVDKEQIDQLEADLSNLKKKYEEEKNAVEQLWEGQKTVFENEELTKALSGSKPTEEEAAEEESESEESVVLSAKSLSKTFHVNFAAMMTLYRYMRFLYNTGDYEGALKLQQKFMELEKYFAADLAKIKGKVLWGKLACDILLGHTEVGFTDIENIRVYINSLEREEPKTVSHLQLLRLRVWLLHWSLFVFMRSPVQEGKDKVVELFSYTTYMNAIQTEAPHLLRYFVVAVVTNKRKQRLMEGVARNIRQNSYMYTDCLTSFIHHMNYADFDGALAALTDCREKLFPNDMILKGFEEEFVQCARLLLFEKFVRVHRRIDVPTLANKLGLSEKEVEQWVVDLIRSSNRFDARIDSAANQMVFGTQQETVYQDVIEVTKLLANKSEDLSRFLEEFEVNGTVASAGMNRYRR